MDVDGRWILLGLALVGATWQWLGFKSGRHTEFGLALYSNENLPAVVRNVPIAVPAFLGTGWLTFGAAAPFGLGLAGLPTDQLGRAITLLFLGLILLCGALATSLLYWPPHFIYPDWMRALDLKRPTPGLVDRAILALVAIPGFIAASIAIVLGLQRLA